MKESLKRTKRIKKNVVGSFLVKGISIVTGFVMVPIALEFVGSSQYGVWLTIASFLTWFGFFEIGLGNGLRNKLAVALAQKDYTLAKQYISTTYAILLIIFGSLLIISQFIIPLVNWGVVFNSDLDPTLLCNLINIVFSFFFIRFIAKLIGVVLVADQHPALSNMLEPLGNVTALILILLIRDQSQQPLLTLSFTLSSMPVFVMILASFILFKTKYKSLSPSINDVNFKHSKELMSLGWQFFFLECFALILFQSTNFLIIHFFGPDEVVSYNIAFKYFSVLNMAFTIIIAPYWSAYTHAWEKNDDQWIKKSINTNIKILAIFLIFYVFMLIFSDYFFKLWIGSGRMALLQISWSLKVMLVIQFSILSFGRIFILFSNGISKLKIQMVSLSIGAVIFFPLVIVFTKHLNMGVEGIVLATICANFYSLIIAPIQYDKLINNKAYGIWNK